MAPVKQKYVLKEGVGQHTLHKGPGEMVIVAPNEVVELTEAQFASFKDKFKPYAQVVAESEVARRTVELEKQINANAGKEHKAEQKRLREEAEALLASQRQQVAEDEDGEEEEEEEEITAGNKAPSISSPAKDADPKAAPKKNK